MQSRPSGEAITPDVVELRMRALMNLAIEPAIKMFEVSTLVVTQSSSQAVKRVLRVLADTPQGAITIVRDRYPRSRGHQVLSCQSWAAALG
jgi:translation initiation factor 2B subunit (eIF-2B alpha/beta/delta family)